MVNGYQESQRPLFDIFEYDKYMRRHLFLFQSHTFNYISKLWLSVMFERWEYWLVPSQVLDVRPVQTREKQCAVWWSPPPSPGTTSSLWREISITDSSATTMITSSTSRYREFILDQSGVWSFLVVNCILIISGRRLRRTTVTTALLSWEKCCLAPGQSSQRPGSLFLRGARLRWDKVWSRSGNLQSMPICAPVVAVLSSPAWGLVTTRKWTELLCSSLFSHQWETVQKCLKVWPVRYLGLPPATELLTSKPLLTTEITDTQTIR